MLHPSSILTQFLSFGGGKEEEYPRGSDFKRVPTTTIVPHQSFFAFLTNYA